MRSERERFARRFYRGLSSPETTGEVEGFVQRSCSVCHGPTKDYARIEHPVCYDCSPPSKYQLKNIRMSVDAASDDSTHPARIADGTAGYNMALPDVPGEVIGKDAYGMTKRKMRPVHNSEIASARQLREMGKRAGLTLLEAPKRAVGGR